MMIHGLSHAAAALVCMVSADFLGERFKALLPAVYQALAQHIAPLVVEYRWPVSTSTVIDLLVVVSVAFVWGAAFRALQDDKHR
jgi:hypothetical protein